MIKISSNGSFPEVSDTISTIFDHKKSLYFLFLGHRTHDIDFLNKNYEASMKSEMDEYRHFLHPFRLSIMKLLFTDTILSSIEIKMRLELSSSEFYNSIRPLEKQNLIRVYDDFDENGYTRQFVILEEKGNQEYRQFIKLIDKFVDEAKEFIPDYDGTDLYP